MKQITLLLLSILAFVSCNVVADDNDKSEYEYKDGLYAEMHTNKGTIILKLEFEKTLLTVTNFVGLAEGNFKTKVRNGERYYDGLKFHRVISNFMIQGGCPRGNGTGDPGYKFADEFDSTLRHDGPGILSMANSGPGTNGSQFFITHVETPWLNDKHTVFGHVVSGQDVVNNIQKDDILKKVIIVRQGEKAKKFDSSWEQFEKLRKAIDDEEMAAAQEKLKEKYKMIADKYPDATTTDSGLMYIVDQEGEGNKPNSGDTVVAHYTGKFLNGRVFDSSVTRGVPFSFPVGEGRVIPGWDEALLDMKKGEKRTLIIPPHLAYGERGVGPIPPNSILIFEVELIDIK